MGSGASTSFKKTFKFCVKAAKDVLEDMGWKEVQVFLMHSRRLFSGHVS